VNQDVRLISVTIILTVFIAILSFITFQAAQDAASAVRHAEESVLRAERNVLEHRTASERQLTEVARFIECSLLVLPDERTLANLEGCAKQAGIDPKKKR
jgi:hypothetical protein